MGKRLILFYFVFISTISFGQSNRDKAIDFLQDGLRLYFKGDFENALSYYNKSIEMDSSLAESHLNSGLLYESYKNDINRAKVQYSKAIALDSKNSSYYFCRGKLYYNIGNYEEAIEDFTNSILIDEYRECRLLRGKCYLQIKKYGLAIIDFTNIIKSYPYFIEAFEYRGQAKFNKGDLAEACSDFKVSNNIQMINLCCKK
jgi:tetratricopeptide (TPR) repeat protein